MAASAAELCACWIFELGKLAACNRSDELEEDGVSVVELNGGWVIGESVRVVVFKFEFGWLFFVEHRLDIENEDEDEVDDADEDDEDDGTDEFGVGKLIATFVE